MATENDDSQSMNGILSNISRDVVDTSWDIPPLTFPKLQPTDSEEAAGADETPLAEPRTIASPYLRKRNSRFRLRQQSRIYLVCRSTPSISMMRVHQPMPRKPPLCHPSFLRQMNRTPKRLRPLMHQMA